MSKQIVISGNRVLAHGEDCFAVTGNTVVCTDSEKVYNNATIATVEEWPADIDTVGYEYHMGAFIPCAPFGTGKGNIAVLCPDDCKSLKDSGIHIDDLSNVLVTTGVPSSGGECTVFFDTDKDIKAVLVFTRGVFGIVPLNSNGSYNFMYFWGKTGDYASATISLGRGYGLISGNSVTIRATDSNMSGTLSASEITFIAIVE